MDDMKRSTPEKAIIRECRWCMNRSTLECTSSDCPLMEKEEDPLTKIRNYCLRCVYGQKIGDIKRCSGRLLDPEFKTCSLHPFRPGNKKVKK